MATLTFDGVQFMIDGKPLSDGVPPCGRITTSSPMYAERIAKLKSEMDAMAEKYKPIADKLVEEIYKSSQKVPPPITNPTTHEPRKHYKPKFTL
jgi:hypothetical protein